MIRCLLLFALAAFCSAEDDNPLPDLPVAYTASLMWNIWVVDEYENSTAMTFSVLETVDEGQQKSMIETEREINYVNEDGETAYYIEYDKIIWRPGVHGVNRFLNIFDIQSGDLSGLYCQADSIRDDSFANFLFGFDVNDDTWYPSVSHMLHWGDKNYTFVKKTAVNGIPVYEYAGIWELPELGGILNVAYFWSDPSTWDSTAGINKTAPVAIQAWGPLTLIGQKVEINMTVEFTDFYEVTAPDTWFLPPVDLWCEGRSMEDELTLHTDHYMYESELVFSIVDKHGVMQHIISPRSEWYDEAMRVSRADYKPPDFSGRDPDPFNNPNGFVTSIQDYVSGLTYSINQELGNCTIQRIDESHDGTDDHGHVHMMNPLYMFFNGDKFSFNGVASERGFEADTFIRSAPPLLQLSSSVGMNITTVLFMTSPDYDVENGDGAERMLPAKIIRYPTDKYHVDGIGMVANFYNFRMSREDFQDFDIGPCFADDNKMHLMMRLGWDENMDIENTLREFYKNTRAAIVFWGQVTPIRVQNIESDIDEHNKALFVIFTVVGYPKNFAPINTESTDAYRDLDEIYSNLESAIEAGDLKIDIIAKSGGVIKAVAEPGSLLELGDRGGSYTYKDGYTPGAMAACGIILLLITIGGFGALLVFVIKL